MPRGISSFAAGSALSSIVEEMGEALVRASYSTNIKERRDCSTALFDIEGRTLDPASLPAEAHAESTDLMRALRAAAAQTRGRHVSDVIVLSDGRDTTGADAFLSLTDYPLFISTVGFAQPSADAARVGDIAVRNVEAPQRAMVHNEVPVAVMLSKDGGDAVELPVSIERAGQVVQTQTISLGSGMARQMVTLSMTPGTPGDFVYTVRIAPPAGDRNVTNNQAMFKLRVDRDPIRVLLVEGVLRSEFTFLRERLGNDPDIDLVTYVRQGHPQQATSADLFIGSELINDERLEQLDVVMLGDFEARMLDETVYEALRTWVEQGGGLMVLGGYQNLSAEGFGTTALAELLPVEPTGGPFEQIEQPFAFELTAEGRTHPAMFLTGNVAEDAKLWADLPLLRGVVATGRPKPAAQVLARLPGSEAHAADGEGYVVLATQPYGKGHVGLMAADTTWRWSRIARLTGRPDTMYVRFWSQMVRWLAKRDINNDRPAIAVSTDAPSYERGQPVRIRVRRNPAVVLPGENPDTVSMVVSITAPDGSTQQVAARRDVEANQWSAVVHPDRGGRFEIAARLVSAGAEGDDAEAGPRDLASQRTEFLVVGNALETENPDPDPGLMRRIAYDGGGLFAQIDDARALTQLLENIDAKPRTVVRTRAATLWNHPALFILFVVCVSLEWLIRRRHELV